MFVFIILNILVFLSAFTLSKKSFDFKDKSEWLLCVFTLFFAFIVFSEQLLGIFGILTLKNLILLNLFLLIVTLILTRKGPWLSPKDLLTEFVSNKVIFFCVSIILGFVIVKSVFTLINAPQGWDSLNYHFTFVVEWLKNGNLVNPITICDDPTPPFYPINNCLFYFWLIAPFKSAFLADLGQLPFYFASFLAVFSICRKFKIDKELSFYAAALLLLTPNYFKQIGMGYADIMAASMFLIALNFIMNFYNNRNLRNLIISSIALGLLLGTKTVALTYCGILCLPLFFVLIFDKNKKIRFKARDFGILFGILILFGGYGYIRNFMNTGNPLFPLNFYLFGKHIFKGVMDASTYRAHWTAEEYNLGKLFFHEGMGIQLLLFVTPALFVIFPLLVIKRTKLALDGMKVFVLSLPHILYINFRYIIVQLWTRFLYPFLGVGLTTAFFILDRLKINKKVIRTLIVIFVLASAAELNKRAELGMSFGLSFLIFAGFNFKDRIKFLNRIPKKIIFLIVVVLLQLAFLNHEKHLFNRYITKSPYWKDAARGWKWINDNTDGNNIAYTGRPVPYPLYGSKYKNDVHYVSINRTHPVTLMDFKNGNYTWGMDFVELHKNLREDYNYRGMANYDVWVRNLEKDKIDFLFVYSLHQTKEILFSIEDLWAKLNPEKFEPVFSEDAINIYKILR